MPLTGEVLIVDDTPQNLQVLGAILASEGLKIRLAANGALALRSVAARLPDLILLDIRMPEMDGIETCRRLRADPFTTAVPVLFLSASQEADERLGAFSAGGLDFIAKPFNAEEVLARVSTHLSLAHMRRELAAANARLTDQVVTESSQRHHAEDVARDRQIRLDLVLSAAGMGTWVAEHAAGEIHLGSETCALLGRTAPLIAGGWKELVAGFAVTDQPLLTRSWDQSLHSGDGFEAEGWWVLGNERQRIRIRGRMPDGSAGRVLGLIWNVTEEFNLRQRLAQSEKLEALGELAGGLAHDFNNHLAVIVGNLELVRRHTGHDTRIIQRLSNIDRAAMTATALVRDLLTFARRREVNLGVIRLAPVVTDLEAMLGSILGRQCSLSLRQIDVELTVFGNSEQLQNTVLNLCVNARDALAGPGQITLDVTRQRITSGRCRICAQDICGDFAVIGVADNGSGIPDELQDRIFEPFFTTKPEGKGTGLGLATVVGCVKSHNGHLLLASRVGEGTTFSILLPLTANDGEHII